MGRQSEAIAARMRKGVEDIVRFITLDIDRRLRRNPSRGGTPVDTGHARANWVPSVGAPYIGLVDGTGNGAHDAGAASIVAYKLAAGACFVTNNVPYILILNDGSSDQAPEGFIERAIDEALAAARDKFGNVNVTVGTREQLGAEIAGNLASAYSPFGGGDD